MRQGRRASVWLLTAGAGVESVCVPLAVETKNAIAEGDATATGADALDGWLRGTGLATTTELVMVAERLTGYMSGLRVPLASERLTTDLVARLDEPVAVRVRWAERAQASARGGRAR